MIRKTANSYRFSPGIVVAAVVAAALPTASLSAEMSNLEPKRAQERQYTACMALASKDPKAAHESAIAWQKKGGGDPAAHCIAAALLGLGRYGQAGKNMEDLASRTDVNRVALKAGLLGQAANAWLISGQAQKAEHLLTDALRLVPMDVEMLLDRSIARASMGKYWEALDDLNDALEKNPDRADALTFRASAWRHVNAFELAETDITAALKQRPIFPDSLLERGLIRKAQGNLAGARADWRRVLEIAVEGPLTEAARRHLQALDQKKK